MEKEAEGARTATLVARPLDDAEKEKLARQDARLLSAFEARKLEENAKKYWDQFYNRNKTNFFKDRHWTRREFEELLGAGRGSRGRLLEIGCGVGNLIFPLVEDGTEMEIFACDFSPRAVDFVKSHELFRAGRVTAFQADIVSDDLLASTGTEVDFATMVFVLSAIHPNAFASALANVRKVLKPGGLVLFRDYGLHDMTQIRFKPGRKISDNLYARQDGTRSYFFSVDALTDLFERAGFNTCSCSYIETRTVNKKEGVDVPRVFVQGKFMRPTG